MNDKPMVREAVLMTVLGMQNDLNAKINPDWAESGHKWYRAVWQEAAEAMGSCSWKWWKKEPIDFDNIKVELVDIFHFLLSEALVQAISTVEEPEGSAMNAAMMAVHNGLVIGSNHAMDVSKVVNTVTPDTITDESIETFRLLIESMASAALTNAPIKDCFSLFAQCWLALGYSLDDIMQEFLIKNVLNVFRQDNGYKEGTYTKIWDAAANLEDNYFVYEIAKSIPVSPAFPTLLRHDLEKKYAQVLEAQAE